MGIVTLRERNSVNQFLNAILQPAQTRVVKLQENSIS